MYFGKGSQTFESILSGKIVEEDQEELSERLRKTWYYGNVPGTDRPSLPVTDLLVDFYNEAAPRELGKLDTYLAASTARSACISPSSVMAGMMYVKRLKKRRPDYLTQVSSSELFLISMMMASKFLYDEGVDDEVFNDEWAASGDLETEDVNQLELDFLSAMDWELFVRQEEFADMLDQIEKRIALNQGIERGWFTYTDMLVLSDNLKLMNWNDLISELSSVFSVTSLAYLASILTLVGSTVLGTATSTAIVKVGSAAIPASFSLLPVLTLTSDLQNEVILSRSLVELPVLEGEKRDQVCNQTVELNLREESWQEEVQDLPMAEGQRLSSGGLEKKSSQKPMVKEHTRSLNGFLSPFLALLTLKDTLFQFVSGATTFLTDGDKQSTFTDPEILDSSITSDNEIEHEFCSVGPCQIDSWPNCWNVTGEYTCNTYNTKDGHEKSKSTANTHGLKTQKGFLTTQSMGNGLGFGHCQRCRYGNEDPSCRGAPRPYRKTYCCCKVRRIDRPVRRGLYQQAMLDINLRFATRSVAPIFVTT